jgi:pilus assembly protein CpaE
MAVVQSGFMTAEATNAGTGRAVAMAFINDADSEAVLRDGLTGFLPEGFTVTRTGIMGAIAALKKMPTPETLIIDVSGEEQPLSALAALSEVVQPDVKVLVVGDQRDVNLYRQLIKVLGVAEYLYNPLVAEVVARHFGPILNSSAAPATHLSGGQAITVTGACGGAGATTIAANLAWYLAEQAKRHTVLLDANLHTGSAAMLLNAKTGPGLRTALESPHRVDALFIERIAQPAGDRLWVMAGEELLTELPVFADEGARHLIKLLSVRYNYIVVDLPFAPMPVHVQLRDAGRQRIIVLEPTLAAVRDTLRLLALPKGPTQARRAVVVLNKLGQPGTMTRKQVEEALQQTVNVAIPYLPRVSSAATEGKPAIDVAPGFKTAIQELAKAIASLPTAAPQKGEGGGLFGWLRRKTP